MSARILIVEDEYLIAHELAEALEEAGFALLGICASVPAALARIAAEDGCDAAVLDASLREVSSVPVAEALSARGIPFVVVSGFSADQLPPALAAAPLINKPAEADDLVAMLREMTARG